MQSKRDAGYKAPAARTLNLKNLPRCTLKKRAAYKSSSLRKGGYCLLFKEDCISQLIGRADDNGIDARRKRTQIKIPAITTGNSKPRIVPDEHTISIINQYGHIFLDDGIESHMQHIDHGVGTKH